VGLHLTDIGARWWPTRSPATAAAGGATRVRATISVALARLDAGLPLALKIEAHNRAALASDLITANLDMDLT